MDQYISIHGLFKARPAEEGGGRFLYMEASNESIDLEGERVLARSLADSRDYFLRYGNIDLDHRTLAPCRQDDPYVWEIGRPVDVQVDGSRTFVKAVLYQGEGRMAEKANLVWESLTQLSPPARWYPSVGGKVLERTQEIDPETKAKVNLITRVRWCNIGLSRTPANPAVPPVATVPVEVFAKCCTSRGFCLEKALEAGYGTDAASLSEGGALRTQSLDTRVQAQLPIPILQQVRDRLARRVGPQALVEYLMRELGLSETEARDYVRRFWRDLIHYAIEGHQHV